MKLVCIDAEGAPELTYLQTYSVTVTYESDVRLENIDVMFNKNRFVEVGKRIPRIGDKILYKRDKKIFVISGIGDDGGLVVKNFKDIIFPFQIKLLPLNYPEAE